jgi:hypothetical protein
LHRVVAGHRDCDPVDGKPISVEKNDCGAGIGVAKQIRNRVAEIKGRLVALK